METQKEERFTITRGTGQSTLNPKQLGDSQEGKHREKRWNHHLGVRSLSKTWKTWSKNPMKGHTNKENRSVTNKRTGNLHRKQPSASINLRLPRREKVGGGGNWDALSSKEGVKKRRFPLKGCPLNSFSKSRAMLIRKAEEEGGPNPRKRKGQGS